MTCFLEIFGSDVPVTKHATAPELTLDDPLFDFGPHTGASDNLSKSLMLDAFAVLVLGDFTDALVGQEGICVKLETTPVVASNVLIKREKQDRTELRKRHIDGLVSAFRKRPVFKNQQFLTDESGTLIWDRIATSLSMCLENAIQDFAR